MKYKVRLNDKIYEVEVEQGEAAMIGVSDAAAAAVIPAPEVPAAAAAPVYAGDGEMISSPLPGSIAAIKAEAGQKVKSGQVLLLIEAMKMENEVVSPRDGVVRQIIVSKGVSVKTGDPLLTLA